jgi:hypothetical protein
MTIHMHPLFASMLRAQIFLHVSLSIFIPMWYNSSFTCHFIACS